MANSKRSVLDICSFSVELKPTRAMHHCCETQENDWTSILQQLDWIWRNPQIQIQLSQPNEDIVTISNKFCPSNSINNEHVWKELKNRWLLWEVIPSFLQGNLNTQMTVNSWLVYIASSMLHFHFRVSFHG